MLLLSSATRILATNHPPTIPHPHTPRQTCRSLAKPPASMYWSTLLGRRQRRRVLHVSEVNTVLPAYGNPFPQPKKRKGCSFLPHPLFDPQTPVFAPATTRERSFAALSFSCSWIPSFYRLLFRFARRLEGAQHPS